MPRASKRDVNLSTPTARGRLKPRRKPYWRFLSEGRYLGYRRHRGNSEAGTWAARFYLGAGQYAEHVLGSANDKAPADGDAVLDFRQAQEVALLWCENEDRIQRGLDPKHSGPYCVAQCMEEYLTWFAKHRRDVVTVRSHVTAHILPVLGDLEVAELRAPQIRCWHQKVAETPPRRRSAEGEAPNFGTIEGADGIRKRKSTANHVLTTLKAALNMAYRDGKVASDAAWRRVKPFKGVDAPRIAFLEREQARRLLNVCDPDFRELVRGGLLTGCRYGELCSLLVGDFHVENQSIYIREAKGWKARDVFLSDEAAETFAALTAGRVSSERLFVRADGQPWGRNHQARRIRDACEVAQIDPPITFHILRHTYASHYLMNGGSLPALSKQLGHADTRMTTRRYGHLADQWRAEEARRHAPSFGTGNRSNVVRLARRASG